MNIYIDNNKIEATAGETVITAALRNNIYVPHFCWHPELSVAGNCRMCLVEVGTPKRNPDGSFATNDNGEVVITYMPKLQIACNTIVSDEMRVNINSQKCIDARASVMEFILINHPLDCPICDEAGACKLQNYSTAYSKGGSRFSEEKNKNPKRVAWNDKIIYDAERCISCSRCIRFTNEIMKEDVLTFINRGDKIRINRFQDKQIENEYSMNVIDNCPVGALTSKDFRFKARVWEMSFNDSICTLCARGCNVSIGTKNNEVLRVQPLGAVMQCYDTASLNDEEIPKQVRYDEKINYWMCDYGRLNLADKVNNKRLSSPKIYEETLKVVSWENAITYTANLLKKNKPEETLIIASPNSSNETNHLLTILADVLNKCHTELISASPNNDEIPKQVRYDRSNIGYIPNINESFADDMLKTKFMSPNTNGLIALGINQIDVNKLIEDINNGTIKTLIAFEEDFNNAISSNPELVSAFAKLKHLILCISNQTPITMYANAILPTATFAEYEGTFTNIDNKVQHFKPIIITDDNMKYVDANIELNRSRLDIFGAKNDKWNQKPVIDFKPTWWIVNELLKLFGISNKYNTATDILK